MTPALADRAYLYILRQIADEAWPAHARVPSMRQIAQQCGASRRPVQAAVHRAAEEGLVVVRMRVGTTVRPGAASRAATLLGRWAAVRQPKRLAIALPDDALPLERDPEYLALVRALLPEAERHRLAATVVGVPLENQEAFARDLVRRYDAAFVIGVGPSHLDWLFDLQWRRFPALLLHRRVAGLRLPSLQMDYAGAARRAARTLADLGHRNMTLVYHSRFEPIMPKPGRFEAWLGYLQEAGLMDHCTMPLAACLTGMFPTVIDCLLHRMPGITALVLGNAAHAWRMAEDPRFAHLRFPRDLSLITLTAVDGAGWPAVWPEPSSFFPDTRRAAQCAVEMIGHLLRGNFGLPDLRVPLGFHPTDSIGPPRDDSIDP